MSRKVTISYKNIKKVIEVDEFCDWEKVAEFLVSRIKSGMLVTLQGDLGAGKTTLTQYIAKQLGISKRTLSPTFALIRSYKVQSNKCKELKRIVHVDAYRIENQSELLALDLDEELMEPGTVMIVEWPEKINNWIDKREDVLKVVIQIKN
jgi:tRNA threonylcarbamoyladenosine biosynthesis protein TsaE